MFDDFILSPWIDRLLFVGVSFLVRLSGHVVCCHPTFGKQVGATRGIEGYVQTEYLWAAVGRDERGWFFFSNCLLETAKCNTLFLLLLSWIFTGLHSSFSFREQQQRTTDNLITPAQKAATATSVGIGGSTENKVR
jgi:hypothetical protein